MRQRVSRRSFLKGIGQAAMLLAIPPRTAPFVAPQPAARTWTTTGHVVPELSSFDTTLQNFMQARNISGSALAVTRNSKLVLARGYTWRDDPDDLIVEPTSLFRLASITKPFTATAVLRLVQDNQLDLNASITTLLNLSPPPGQSPDSRLSQVTVRRLLQHLGGWDRDIAFDPMFRDAIIANAIGVPLPIAKTQIATYMTGQSLQHDPGTTYAYSNYGYSLLGQIIEAVSGQSYDSYIAANILLPLRITRVALGRTLLPYRLATEVKYHSQYQDPTVFDSSGTIVPSPYGAWNLENMDSHGALLASAIDVVKFATAFDDPAASPLLAQAT